jgi:integrase
MPLTDAKVRSAKPQDKPRKLFDERGLFLLITSTGGKWWRLKYRHAAKEKLLSLGVYPEVSLKEARAKRDEARRQITAGIDPSEVRKAKRAASASTLEGIAREWIGKRTELSQTTRDKIIRRLELDVFPHLGDRAVSELTPPMVLSALTRVEKRGANETTHRLLNDLQRIFTYCIATSRITNNPAIGLGDALQPVVVTHRASITDPKAIGPLLRSIEAYGGSAVVKAALQLSPLLLVRPGELRHARWEEFDLSSAVWSIPGERMKMKQAHIVPLSIQALRVFQHLRELHGGNGYVLPSPRSCLRPLSENTVNAALSGLGYSGDLLTAHGFRAMARTILDEVLGVRPDFIEHQLAYAVRDPNGRAYNRTAHLVERRKMMQQWADYLDKLKVGAAVIALRDQAA